MSPCLCGPNQICSVKDSSYRRVTLQRAISCSTCRPELPAVDLMSSEHVYRMSRMAASYTKSLRGWSYGTNTTPQPRARPMPPTTQPSHTAHMLKAPSARLFCGISSPGSRSCCWAPGWPILVELGPSESPQRVLLPWAYARRTARSGSVVRSDGRCRCKSFRTPWGV